MTLDKCKRGQRIKIMNISNEMVRSQAIRFGISEGAIMTCEEVLPAGPIVVGMFKQKIAIGRDLARSIDVQPVNL